METPLLYAVDDEESILSLYKESLPLGGYRVETALNGDQLFSLLKIEKPSMIILDVMLGKEDGFSILSKLKNSSYGDIPVIMVSAKGNEIDKVNGLNLGADDYIVKPFGILELLARIKANLRKYPKKASTYKDIRISEKESRVFIGEEEVKLTKIEFYLLSFLIKAQGDVVTKEELFSKIWGLEGDLETRTLDIHMSNLRKKISESQVKIETVRGVGYRLA